MQTVKSIWDFFQTELLGMSWLNRLIGDLLNACGLDTAGKVGGSVQFFIYDTIKIMVLLGVLILIISYILTVLFVLHTFATALHLQGGSNPQEDNPNEPIGDHTGHPACNDHRLCIR